MAITKTNRLNMTGGGVPVIVRLSQYDDDFTLIFELYSTDGTFTIASGTTAAIRGTKADGMGYSVDATLDVSNKRVTVTGDQQMTAMAGKNVFELTLSKSNKELNTANFILDVERAALDKDTLKSDSVIKELVDVIDRTDEIIAAAEMADAASEVVEEMVEQAEADRNRAEIAANLAQIYGRDFRVPLLACFRNIAWINEDGEQYYQALYDALYPSTNITSISATFNQGSHEVHPDDTLNSLKQYLTVTARYSDNTTGAIINYTLNGTLSLGVSVITVTANGKTSSFRVTVTPQNVSVSSIEATFTQGSAIVYTSDTLESLKQYLTVVATFSDSSESEVANYALSGTLSEGTSTITVTYGGKTDTFNVAVTSGTHITAVFNQGVHVVYKTDTLASLKSYLTVTYYDSPTATGEVVPSSDYTLSGTLTSGTSTITVTYNNLQSTFDVIVSNYDFEWSSLSEEPPAGMLFTEEGYAGEHGYTFTDGIMFCRNPQLDFDHVGPCELEVEMSWEDEYSNTASNNPQIIIVTAKSGNTANGAKIFSNYNNMQDIRSNVSGTTQNLSTDPYDMHVYNFKYENNAFTLKVDNEIVDTGSGVTNNAYLNWTGIYCDTTSRSYLYIKSIKYRSLST